MSSRELNLDLLLDSDFDLGSNAGYVPTAVIPVQSGDQIYTVDLNFLQQGQQQHQHQQMGASAAQGLPPAFGPLRYQPIYSTTSVISLQGTFPSAGGYPSGASAYPPSAYQPSTGALSTPVGPHSILLPFHGGVLNDGTLMTGVVTGDGTFTPLLQHQQHPLQATHYITSSTLSNLPVSSTDQSVVDLLNILDNMTTLNSTSPQGMPFSPLQPEETAFTAGFEPSILDTRVSPEELGATKVEATSPAGPQQPGAHQHHQCVDCQATFEEFSALETHYLQEHDKKHICKFCDKPFPRQFDLQRHERVHTGERPFVCSVCAKSFNQKCSLVMHERTHSGDKPYQCRYCDMTFSESTNRVKHERIHTGEKPYECKVCSKRFTSSSHMHRHEKTHLGTPMERRLAAAAAASGSPASSATPNTATSSPGESATPTSSASTHDHESSLSTCQYCFMEFEDSTACLSHESSCPTKAQQDRPVTQTSLV